jgi:hypothetical protein
MYTFPAVSLFYENSISSSAVHSCIRTYNLGERNSDYAIGFPQTGFDVILGDAKRNYICFYGGGEAKCKLSISLEFRNQSLIKDLEVENRKYAQQHLIIVEDLFELEAVAAIAKISISHDLGVFPRFYVGVIQENSVPTLTHTFFDTSESVVDKKRPDHDGLRAKNIDVEKYFDAAFLYRLLNLVILVLH